MIYYIYEIFKKNVLYIFVLARYFKFLSGFGVSIKSTLIHGSNIRIYGKAILLRTSIKSNTTIYNSTTLVDSSLAGNNKIGRECSIVGSEIGAFSYVSDNSTILNTKVGKFCSIAAHLNIGLAEHPIYTISTSPIFYSKTNFFGVNLVEETKFQEFKKSEIGNDVWIGFNVFIKAGIKIGNGSIIAAGSIVTKDVEPYSIVGGNPARFIRYRFSPEVINFLEELHWWDLDFAQIIKYEDIFKGETLEIETLYKIKNVSKS
jgi:acetyltransferase-like isoleucine patch superfamily enzyme